MSSLPTLPQRTWLERAALALASAVAAIGGVTILGWWLGLRNVLQPLSERAALDFNGALGIAVIGGVLLALEFGRKRLAWLALVPAALGALALLAYSTDGRFNIDELFIRDTVLAETAYAGRMPLMFAVSLLVVGVVLLWHVTQRAARLRCFAEAASGSVLAAAGLATLLGYIANLQGLVRWGSATATSPAAALALLCLGGALVSVAWRESMKLDGESPSWSPMPAIVGCLSLTMILWLGLRDRELANVREKTTAASDTLATDIRRRFDEQVNFYERLARQRADAQEEVVIGWQEKDVKQQFEQSRPLGCVLISFLDADTVDRWHHPQEGFERATSLRHNTAEVRAAALTLCSQFPYNPAVTGTTDIYVPNLGIRKGFVIYAPVVRGRTVIGYVAAEFIYEKLFAATAAANRRADAEYNVSFALNSDIIYTSPGDAPASTDLSFDKTYVVYDRRMRLTHVPTLSTLRAQRSFLPELALGAGSGITLLLGLSVHLARRARAGQRAAELSNKKLFAENEERRRVEARLKVSDERLRLALDSTQIGIFEWSVAAGHVYYSPGLWAMLGYEHTRMPSTVEAWQSMIHPDDLPLYRRRTESQLNGIASFIEPEYRVRARSGDWRWVYTRSKSVATNPDGRPTRIVGTVQDITARREAEIALRESQAEARKLSLVASKTDNPVLIGSPDGRIEWANEAFCRFMEYELDEVVGKNPAHFMVGPETNPRTIAKIRTAMARGQGISTDVVNYSKSGRKYHVHIEIQPVRNASDEIENFIAVETDITARVETEQQLRRAKSEADDASRAKSEFLASMSHEIRTPMNGVIGMTSLLMETTLSAEQRDFVNTIRTSGEALLTIINDILDFSKIESGKMELERAPFELALCIEDALDLFALQASAKKLEIGYHLAPDVPGWIMGDVTRLRQVVVNLVNNAVKFTPSGSVSIEVRRAHREPTPLGFDPGIVPDPNKVILEFAVRDTGIGIPADRVDRLFKAFSQVDSSTTRKYGGTGLGLAICQRLCELMGGVIRVESTAGEGSSFIFTIQTEPAPTGSESGLSMLPPAVREGAVLCIEDHPVTQARLRTTFEKWGVDCVIVPDAPAALEAAANLPRPPSLVVVDAGELDGSSPAEAIGAIACPRLLLFPFGQTAPTAADSHPLASTSKPIRTGALLHAITTLFNPAAYDAAIATKRAERPVGEEIPLEVLLAEDNAVNQKVALRFLERLGYRADAVGNGLEAVHAIENRRYDLVLMDLQMPEMDGFEATRQIRMRLPAERQPKIIALTANAMQGDRELCVAAGMDDHITKPVKLHEIAGAIRRHFAKPADVPTTRQWIE